MYNTHPKLCYKILGKKVRIILEILRYMQKICPELWCHGTMARRQTYDSIHGTL